MEARKPIDLFAQQDIAGAAVARQPLQLWPLQRRAAFVLLIPSRNGQSALLDEPWQNGRRGNQEDAQVDEKLAELDGGSYSTERNLDRRLASIEQEMRAVIGRRVERAVFDVRDDIERAAKPARRKNGKRGNDERADRRRSALGVVCG